jgi:hypothetical protein
MATPYHSSIRRQPPNQVDEPSRDDDWLADEGGVDWFFDPGRADERERDWPHQERTRAGLIQSPHVASAPTPEETFQRRRMLALAAIVVGVVIAIVVAVVASGGGGGSPSAVPTTVEETTPATPTTTPTNASTTAPTTTASPSLRVTIPAGGNLSAGDSGSQVLTLQKALKQLGLDVGTPDGKFGQKTQDAVKAFQTAHNLTPDGVVGADTEQAINDALASSAG